MFNRIHTLNVIVLASIVFGAVGGTVRAAIITVCWDGSGDYLTIQEGINAALEGDEVVVCDGTYTGLLNKNLDFGGKDLTVRSAGGNPDTCIVDCEASGRGFYLHSGETAAALIAGLTITNGRGDGGGICCVGSSPTIINCVFLSDWADMASGGGIYSEDGSPLIRGCHFESCACNSDGFPGYGGGGIYCAGGAPQIIANRFVGCTAYVFCTEGGGAISFHETDIVIESNVILDGWVHGAGGGIAGHDSQVDISRNVIAGCFGFHYGGGLALRNSSGTLSHNLIINNESNAYGGGIYLVSDSNVDITFCTIVDNTAVTQAGTYGFGGGVCLSLMSEALIHNCIIWENTAIEGEQIYASESETATVSYCDVQGGWPGDGNMDNYPYFADPDGGDYRLTGSSPCIDAGDPAFVPGSDETDLDGHARVLCGQVDMGAYEFGIGDYDCNGVVDLVDFHRWPGCMAGPSPGPYNPGCAAFDFEYDGEVDLADFAGFQRAFNAP